MKIVRNVDSLIVHCAVSSNNLDSRYVKLSAIDVIAQAILELLYFVSGLSQFASRGNFPMYPDPHRTIACYFSILVPIFSQVSLNFLVNTIHQVIWPSSVGGGSVNAFLAAALARVMRVAVPIPAVASASVLHSAAVGGSVVGVVRPL